MADVLTDIDLGAMFGIELNQPQESDAAVTGVVCQKCKGRGNFISHSGRIVGRCFTCDGSGLALAPKAMQDGDCTKCGGSGEWRPGRPCFACKGSGREDKGDEISVRSIEVAFAAARAHQIKRPKLRLGSVIFSLAPETGRNAGSIYVKDAATKDYLGKVTSGRFFPAMACDEPKKAEVIEVAADPHNAAKAYGRRVGRCSCCGLELTNEESITLGIGPICREKYGW